MYELHIKRVLDIVISFLTIVIISPLLLFLVIIGAIAMHGNPFFVQVRTGLSEKNFKLIKFRTMSNAKDSNGKLLSNELRLNKYGRILRATSLDELPELFNIFVGDMSIVGPRPLLPEYLPYYTPEEHHRHDVRPGLTGLAQINGRNTIANWEERFGFDLKYVKECSFVLDVKIILKTVGKVIKRTDVVVGNEIGVVGRLDEVRNKVGDKLAKTEQMQKLAIIGGGRMAVIFAQNAREMGVETYCFSLESGIVDKDAFDFIYPVNILEREKVLELCKMINIDGVVATTELTIAVAAYIADKMNLVGIPLDVAEVITDKYRNRKAIQDIEEICQPKYAEIWSAEDIYKLKYDYPIILKPTSKGGKRGVVVIKQEAEIPEAFSYTMEDAGGELPFIVEEYIEGGMECSVESLSYNGTNYIVQVTEKINSGPPHCVELAHHQPANLSKEQRELVERVLDKALSAIGLENGPCHTEIKIKDGKLYLIEFNARPGGDHIAAPLTELSTGYSYIKGGIQIALNQFTGIDKSKFKEQYAGILFVTKQTSDLCSVFECCQEYDWCYEKNVASQELKDIIHNDGFNLNYFIYVDNKRHDFC